MEESNERIQKHPVIECLFFLRNSYLFDKFLNYSCQSFECYAYYIILRKNDTCTDCVYVLNDRVELSHYENRENGLYVVLRINLEEIDHESSREEEHKSYELCHYSYAHSLGR